LEFFYTTKEANALFTEKLISLLGDPQTFDFQKKTDLAASAQLTLAKIILNISEHVLKKIFRSFRWNCFFRRRISKLRIK